LTRACSARLRPQPDATADQLAAFARLDQRRRRPNVASHYLPTRIGNILRAAETWPADKYGLDAVVVWPRLWLLLPDISRQELLAARAALDSAVAAVIWGLLFCVFTIWTPFAIPAGLAVAAAAVAFGCLTGRRYSATCWKPPTTFTAPPFTSSSAGPLLQTQSKNIVRAGN
jgi:hypothetical protein